MKIDPGKLGNWGSLYDALLAGGLGVQTDANTQFQFLTTPQVANWTTQTNQYYADLWGNNAPFSLGPGTSGPQIDVSDAYYEFISSLVLPVPSSPPYEKLKTQLGALSDQRGGVVTEALGAFKIWQQQDGDNFPDIKTFSDWLASSLTAGGTYLTQMDDLDKQIASVKAQLRPFEVGVNAAYTQAVKDADPANKVPVVNPGSSTPKNVYSTSLVPSLNDFLAKMSGGATLNPLNVTLTRGNTYKGEWYVEGAADTTFWGVIGFEAEGGFTRDTKVETDSQFSANLKVKGLQTFNIARDTWMHSNMIAEHMAGPFAGTGQSEDQFFGDKGSLKLLPTQLLVAYGATFSLTMSSSYYQQVKQTWEAAGGLLIGPFFIGGESAGNSTTVTENNQSTTISVGSNNDPNAYVIGISSLLFYDGAESAKARPDAREKARVPAVTRR